MERESLKAVFSEAAASKWSLESDIQLQEWLERFSKRLLERTDNVAVQVHNLVDQTFSVEQDLQNTFNHFRSLSNSQFIENRVYEEDETSIPITEAATQQHADAIKEDFEGGIVPRYKEAVLTAWRVLEESKIASKHSVLSELDRATRKARRPLPFVVGTEEYFRDVKCGLADSRKEKLFPDVSAPDSDTESHGTDLARGIVGKALPSETEWSDSSDVQEESLEPAVSAALDFKAMLESALRGPSLSYDDDDGTVPHYGTSLAFFAKVDGVNALGEDPRSLDLLQRSVSENRKHNSIVNEDDEGSGAPSTDGTSSSRIASVTRGRQNEPPISTSTVQANEEIQEANYPQFEFPVASTVERNHVAYSGKLPFVGNSSGSAGDKMVKSYSSISQFPSTSMQYAPPGLNSIVVPGSSTEPTVPEDIFQRSQPGQSSQPKPHDSGQEQPSIPTNQQPGDSRLTSSPGVKKPTVVNPPLQKQFQGGLFDEDEDGDEDDSYILHLMKQKTAASNQNRSARSWSRIGAGKGLFDESDSKASSPEDAKSGSPKRSGGSLTAYGDDSAPAAESSMATHLDPEYVQPLVRNNLLATALTGGTLKPSAIEDDTLSWSSTDESHTGTSSAALSEGLTGNTLIHAAVGTTAPSISQLPSKIQPVEKLKGGSQTDAARAGMPYPSTTHPVKGAVLDASSVIDSDLTENVTTADQYNGEGRHIGTSEAATVETASLLRDFVEDSQKEGSSRRFLLFGEDDDDDDDEMIFETKRGSHLQQDLEAPDVGLSKTKARHLADQTDRPVDTTWEDELETPSVPATTVSRDRQSAMAKSRELTQQPTAAMSKSIGSTYLSSILFGDEEENEDELFGSFVKGSSRTRSALDPSFGKHSTQDSSLDSGDWEGESGPSKLAPDVTVPVDGRPQVRVEHRRRSLFDD